MRLSMTLRLTATSGYEQLVLLASTPGYEWLCEVLYLRCSSNSSVSVSVSVLQVGTSVPYVQPRRVHLSRVRIERGLLHFSSRH